MSLEILVRGRFQLGKCLGEGAFAQVFAARDENGRQVALKYGRDVARLRQEYEALSAIEHANVVAALDFHVNADEAALVLERVNGASFVDALRADLVAAPGPSLRRNLPMAFGYPMQEEGVSSFRRCSDASLVRLRALVPVLARALDAVHRAGFLHLDVRPDNVIVGERLVLLDLGLAHVVDTPLPAGALVGSAAYLAPELARGAATDACDAYSVGALIYEALTGRAPFEGGGPEVLVRKQSLEAPAPSEVVSDVPADLDALCRGLLARSPAKRTTLRELFG
ncbi:MAG: serine/threonine-protein kinase [Myxococcota bacterium]